MAHIFSGLGPSKARKVYMLNFFQNIWDEKKVLTGIDDLKELYEMMSRIDNNPKNLTKEQVDKLNEFTLHIIDNQESITKGLFQMFRFLDTTSDEVQKMFEKFSYDLKEIRTTIKKFREQYNPGKEDLSKTDLRSQYHKMIDTLGVHIAYVDEMVKRLNTSRIVEKGERSAYELFIGGLKVPKLANWRVKRHLRQTVKFKSKDEEDVETIASFNKKLKQDLKKGRKVRFYHDVEGLKNKLDRFIQDAEHFFVPLDAVSEILINETLIMLRTTSKIRNLRDIMGKKYELRKKDETALKKMEEKYSSLSDLLNSLRLELFHAQRDFGAIQASLK